VHPNSIIIFSFDLEEFSMKKSLNIHNFSTLGQNIMKPTQSTSYSSRAFEQYQKCNKRCCNLRCFNLRDLNVTQRKKQNLPSYIDGWAKGEVF
jgi:hypothetical protein